MVTVLRSGGFRVVIFVNDHQPAHVHVFGDGEAKINLIGTPEVVSADTMTRGEVRRALRLVIEYLPMLRERWEAIHGGTDGR